MNPIEVSIETGEKRVFASAVDWPGWCRSGRDEQAALQALLDYGPRYAQVLHGSEIAFQPPSDAADLLVTERHEGNATTDFGAPAIVLHADRGAMDQGEFERARSILLACWQAFDGAVQRATGQELQKGPRGGGRDLEEIVVHVLEADERYLAKLAWKHKRDADKSLVEELDRMRQAILDALQAAVRGDLPERGPRGGSLWPPRYFVRRVAWHVLDHAWEIDDRIVEFRP